MKSRKNHSTIPVSLSEAAPEVTKEKLCSLSGWVNAPDDLARLEVRKGWWIGAYSVLDGELLFASRSLNALCRKLKQRPGMVWPVGVCSASTKKGLSVPASVAQSPKQKPRYWPEELKRVRNMTDGVGFLTFEPDGNGAWDAVRQLAQTNDALELEKRIASLWRMYPKVAETLGLPKPPESDSTKKATYSDPGLELRDEKARGVAQGYVSFSLPQGSTYADQIQEIAKQLNWRVEPLPDQLRKSSFPRGRTVFGAADKVLGEIAENHDLKWILEGGVLRFTANPPTTEASAKSKNRGGRPRKDDEREKVRVKHAALKNWKQIAKEMNEETGQEKTPEAYRALLKSRSANPVGKNVQK